MSGGAATGSGEAARPASARLLLVVGARPNFVKAGPVFHAAAADSRLSPRLVHTGQHYDANLSAEFFRELQMPEPDVYLGVGSGSHGAQTAEVLRRLEPVLIEERPDCVVVFGDVNSTLAASLAAVKLRLPVAHVEAGLRSFDRSMPEEINRRVTDTVSDLLFTTEASGGRNLRREGIPQERIVFVGNTMVDSLLLHRQAAGAHRVAALARLGIDAPEYAVLTLHRPSNVDQPRVLAGILGGIERLAGLVPVAFPVHPRTRDAIERAGLGPELVERTGLRVTEPLSYLEFLGLMDGARLVLTDSGGIQEETTVLGVPCLTLRDNTERPVTVTGGTNRLVGSDPAAILTAAREVLAAPAAAPPPPPPLWDGHASQRIAAELARRYAS
jgi:UDP-N-acetylglucosamine 2-epimerase (non-hydrolysing)